MSGTDAIMRPEVVLACLTLCLVEAGSSLKRRHLTTVLSGNSVRLTPKPQASVVEGVTDSSSHWTSRDALRDSDQSTVAFLRWLTSGSRDSPRDLLSIFRHKHLSRADSLLHVLQRIAQQVKEAANTSAMTKRQMTKQMTRQMDKRRRRYRCDLNRVTLQMILSYFRSRTLCGYRVTRMRFGLGGK